MPPVRIRRLTSGSESSQPQGVVVGASGLGPDAVLVRPRREIVSDPVKALSSASRSVKVQACDGVVYREVTALG